MDVFKETETQRAQRVIGGVERSLRRELGSFGFSPGSLRSPRFYLFFLLELSPPALCQTGLLTYSSGGSFVSFKSPETSCSRPVAAGGLISRMRHDSERCSSRFLSRSITSA